MLRSSGFADDVTSTHNVPRGALCEFLSGESANPLMHKVFSAYMPWQFRLSVRLSDTRVDQSKAFEVFRGLL